MNYGAPYPLPAMTPAPGHMMGGVHQSCWTKNGTELWCPPSPRCTLTSLAKYNLAANIIGTGFSIVDFAVLAFLSIATVRLLKKLIHIAP